MRKSGILLLLVLLGSIGFTNPSSAATRSGSYVALKAGVYSPSSDFTLDNLDLETTFDTDTRTGFDGEIAFGHYVLPTLALEVGVGYLRSTGEIPSDSMDTDHPVEIGVIPIIASVKALIPVGVVDPYGEVGIGAYVTKLDVDGNLEDFDATTTFGVHAGAGVNVNLSPGLFLGAEGRYVWADPSIGGERIDLNPEIYSVSEFKLNGFTTTFVLGFGF